MKNRNNKLAVFVGYKYVPDSPNDLEHYVLDGRVLAPYQIKFDSEWNWLMGVVDKINSIGRFEVVIGRCYCYIKDERLELTLSCPEVTTMQAVYVACANFVEWYELQR